MTTITITHDNADEFETHRFSAMASDLGLPVGMFPASLQTTLGNRMPLLRQTKRVSDGDLLWVTYQQANGCIQLRIFND